MFSKVRNRHERRGSSSSPAVPPPSAALPPIPKTVPPPLVSPLQMTFDFELNPPAHSISTEAFRPSEDSLARPTTSDGLGISSAYNRKSTIGLSPPILPPIPRVASRHQSTVSPTSAATSAGGKGRARDESDNVSTMSAGSRKSTGIRLLPQGSFEQHPVELMPKSNFTTTSSMAGPVSTRLSDEARPSTSSGTTPRMQASIFPSKAESPILPMIDAGALMSREFIDSRDKPYSQPSHRQTPSQIQVQPQTQPARQAASRPPPVQSTQSMPFLPANHPNMLALQSQSPALHVPPPLQSPASFSSFYSQSPASPHMPTPSSPAMSLRAPKISGARLSPNSSVEDLRMLQRSPTNGTGITSPTNGMGITRSPTTGTTMTTMTAAPSLYSGSTAHPSLRSSVTRAESYSPSTQSTSALSPGGQSTIGTPYQETSQSFPLPQHVSVRPKTAGASSTVAGVSVPTHHSSAGAQPARPESGSSVPAGVAKAEKRKTRLLNPLALLSRRKSAQESEEVVAERSATAQAYARQKSVAALGVDKMPADFDPRIKGNKVHDFSAPRQPKRNFSYNDAYLQASDRQLQSANSTPSVPLLQTEDLDGPPWTGHSKHTSDSSSVRKSAHSPMFREMLSEDPDAAKRVSSLNAERLENKDWLQRVSHQGGHQSSLSQESAVLPPFARRSQVMDPMQATYFQEADDGSKRSSDPSSGSGRERDSGLSSISEVSPVTQRSSGMGMQSQVVETPGFRNSLGLSPVSPRTPEKSLRPISSVSDVSRPISSVSDLPPPLPSPTLGSPMETRGRIMSEATARPSSARGAQQQDLRNSLAESPRSPARVDRARSPYRNSADAPELALPTLPPMMIPDRSSSLGLDMMTLPIPLPGRTSDLPTPELTPEIGTANVVPLSATAIKPMSSPPKVVEKRASAVGHSHRSSGIPKKHVSNASRFSFQFGESAVEEEKLEEKHRVLRGESGEYQGVQKGEEEEEDEFDEDAIDDMDELEVEQHQHDDGAEEEEGVVLEAVKAAPRPIMPPTRLSELQQTRKQLQSDSDDEASEDEVPEFDEQRLRHLTWAEHPAMRAHSALAFHSRDGSLAGAKDLLDLYAEDSSPTTTHEDKPLERKRAPSGASALTLDTSNVPTAANAAFVQDNFSRNESMPGGAGAARPRSGFYMQPKAAGYSPHASPQSERPPVPSRQSGNSERNRVASGMSFASASEHSKQHARDESKASSLGVKAEHQRVISASTTGNRSSEARTNSSGLGLSGFSDFLFNERPDSFLNGTRPTSVETDNVGNANRRTRDSETMPLSAGWADLQKRASGGTPLSNGRASGYFSSPDSNTKESAAYRGAIGKGLRERNAASNQNIQYAVSDSGEESGDDMYFDDGGFEQDIKHTAEHRHDSVDEDEFDNDAYLGGANRLGAFMPGNQRRQSAMTAGNSSGDGPYPSFAMGSNPVKARARQSQMLLEDLPLFAGPVDPKLIPQRNPSEDAKRLGLSNKVPPLPPQPGSQDAVMQMQLKMQAYHAALADAANKAAVEGRFMRQPSVATTTRSLSIASHLLVDDQSHDDRSHYSRDEMGDMSLGVPQDDGLSRAISEVTTGSKMDQSTDYSPPKMTFDFGFSDTPGNESVLEDFEADDDLVAAANSDVLGSDDAAFYGQEFGFYANKRPDSGEMQAINGGYFGEEGDDGLARNKSWREPNLTPLTERTEMSARNSFIVGHGGGLFGPASAGPFGPASPAAGRLPTSPLVENEITNFDQLRKLRANAFGGSNGSLRSEPHPPGKPLSGHLLQGSTQSPISAKSAAAAQGYFGPMGGPPMSFAYSANGTDSSGNSIPNSALPAHLPQFDSPARHGFHESPQSGASSMQFPFGAGISGENGATPRKTPAPVVEPTTARKVNGVPGHARKGSDSVTYVREPDPTGNGQPRWVLERRRTSEQGQLELVGREVVQGGWI